MSSLLQHVVASPKIFKPIQNRISESDKNLTSSVLSFVKCTERISAPVEMEIFRRFRSCFLCWSQSILVLCRGGHPLRKLLCSKLFSLNLASILTSQRRDQTLRQKNFRLLHRSEKKLDTWVIISFLCLSHQRSFNVLSSISTNSHCISIVS